MWNTPKINLPLTAKNEEWVLQLRLQSIRNVLKDLRPKLQDTHRKIPAVRENLEILPEPSPKSKSKTKWNKRIELETLVLLRDELAPTIEKLEAERKDLEAIVAKIRK